MRKKVRVAIIDDHPVVRRGVSETFSEEADFEVVGEGASAADAVRIAREKVPDLMVLDVTMPGGGIEALSEICKVRPGSAVLMLSIREDLSTVQAALKAGARGYISKGVDAADLIQSARRVIAGERCISSDLAVQLLAPNPDLSAEPVPPSYMATLTRREQEIFQYLGKGLSNQEIADQIGLTENTVKHYITPLLRKLGVRNRTEAALLAGDL